MWCLPLSAFYFCESVMVSFTFLVSSCPCLPVLQVIELYRFLAVGISLWNRFAVPVLFTVFWIVLFVVQLYSDTMSANASAGHQGIMFFLLSRCDVIVYIIHRTLHLWLWLCLMSCCDLTNSTVSLNVVPRRTLFWVWPSWCPISLSDYSAYASSTWEVLQLFKMRMSCTGERISGVLTLLALTLSTFTLQFQIVYVRKEIVTANLTCRWTVSLRNLFYGRLLFFSHEQIGEQKDHVPLWSLNGSNKVKSFVQRDLKCTENTTCRSFAI